MESLRIARPLVARRLCCAVSRLSRLRILWPSKLPPGAHVIMRGENRGIPRPAPLRSRQRPDVELALLAFRIGIERSGEGALRRGHLALEPADGLRARAARTADCRCAARPAPAVPGAGRCRRASSRNAAPASARRPNSARSRRRDGRRCRPRSCARACARPSRRSARRRVRSPARQSNSRIAACGNFGAPRKPAVDGSNMLPTCRAAPSSSLQPDGRSCPPAAPSRRAAPSARRGSARSCRGSSRNSRATSRSTSTKAGRPKRDSFGK